MENIGKFCKELQKGYVGQSFEQAMRELEDRRGRLDQTQEEFYETMKSSLFLWFDCHQEEMEEGIKQLEEEIPNFLVAAMKNIKKNEDVAVDVENQEAAGDMTDDEIKKKQRTEAEEFFEEVLKDVRIRISGYTPAWREKLLTELLNETSDMVGNVTRLASMEDEICKFYDCLDLRTKLIIEIGSQIACVESTIGTRMSYGQDLINRRFEDHKSVIAAINELSDDPEIAYLGEAYMLAHLICED